MAIPRPTNNFTYQLMPFGVKRSDGALIPNDPKNGDWQAYLRWVAAGNKASPEPPPPPVARAITDYFDRLTPTQQQQVFAFLVNQLPGLTAAQKTALTGP